MITHVASSHNLGIGMAAVNLARANGEQVSNLSHHVANGSQEGVGVELESSKRLLMQISNRRTPAPESKSSGGCDRR